MYEERSLEGGGVLKDKDLLSAIKEMKEFPTCDCGGKLLPYTELVILYIYGHSVGDTVLRWQCTKCGKKIGAPCEHEYKEISRVKKLFGEKVIRQCTKCGVTEER